MHKKNSLNNHQNNKKKTKFLFHKKTNKTKLNKKMIMLFIVIICISLFLYFNISTETEQNVENIEEIQPQEEISEEQDNTTEVKLFFNDATSGVLTYEKRNINAKELIQNPYMYVMQLLIKGPEKNNLKSCIPEGTKVNSAKLEKEILHLDLSEEFLNSKGMDSIYSITNTLSQFNEVQSVKFTINGETKDNLKEAYIRNE